MSEFMMHGLSNPVSRPFASRDVLSRRLHRVLMVVFSMTCSGIACGEELPSIHPGSLLTIGIPSRNNNRPTSYFGRYRTAMIKKNQRWHSLTAIPYDTLPGTYIITYRKDAETLQALEFRVLQTREPEVMSALLPSTQSSNRSQQRQILEHRKNLNKLFRQWQEGEFQGAKLKPVFTPDEALQLSRDTPANKIIGYRYEIRKPQNLLAPLKGKVVWLETASATTQVLILQHSQGMFSVFTGIDQPTVTKDQEVQASDILANILLDRRNSPRYVTWSLVLNGAEISPELFLGNR